MDSFGGNRVVENPMSEHPVVALIRAKMTDLSRPFVLLAELEAQPGRGEDVAAAIVASQVVGRTRAEPGCIAYDLCRDADFPDRFVAYENWRDCESLRNHLATPHFAAVGAALGGLLAAAPVIRVLASLGSPTSAAPDAAVHSPKAAGH